MEHVASKPSIKHKTDERVPYPEPVVMLSAQEHALHFINILMTAKQAVRPKSSIPKSIEEATKTVDDVFNVSIQIQVLRRKAKATGKAMMTMTTSGHELKTMMRT